MTKTLPHPRTRGSLSLEEAIALRRSVRSFSARGLSDDELSQLLWAAQGVTDPEHSLRTAPSAGATYPLEVYAATADCLFHYLPATHELKPVRVNDVRRNLAAAALGQECVRDAAAVIILAAESERTTRSYGQRGYRYAYMEAGHVAQNVHLEAVALGLGSVAIGAFDDDAVAGIMSLPRGRVPLYLIPVGQPR